MHKLVGSITPSGLFGRDKLTRPCSTQSPIFLGYSKDEGVIEICFTSYDAQYSTCQWRTIFRLFLRSNNHIFNVLSAILICLIADTYLG
jgi:hypothetical protein